MAAMDTTDAGIKLLELVSEHIDEVCAQGYAIKEDNDIDAFFKIPPDKFTKMLGLLIAHDAKWMKAACQYESLYEKDDDGEIMNALSSIFTSNSKEERENAINNFAFIAENNVRKYYGKLDIENLIDDELSKRYSNTEDDLI